MGRATGSTFTGRASLCRMVDSAMLERRQIESLRIPGHLLAPPLVHCRQHRGRSVQCSEHGGNEPAADLRRRREIVATVEMRAASAAEEPREMLGRLQQSRLAPRDGKVFLAHTEPGHGRGTRDAAADGTVAVAGIEDHIGPVSDRAAETPSFERLGHGSWPRVRRKCEPPASADGRCSYRTSGQRSSLPRPSVSSTTTKPWRS